MLKRKITALIPVLLMIAILFASCGKAQYAPDTGAVPSAAPNKMSKTEYLISESGPDSLKYSNSSGYENISGFNTEEYNPIVERGFVSPLAEPMSTFSIDVDTASYANVRRFLMDGFTVPPDAVRIEEMINYFRYDYPNPDGDAPFSVTTEIGPCPWNEENKLLMIGLKGREVDIRDIPPSNLVFLIDVSGSMLAANKLPLVKEAFLLLVENLRPIDRISIVTYAGSESVVLNGATGEDKLAITRAIQDLGAGGSTAGARGILTAYKIAQENFIENGNNRVILATDGDFNVGVTSEGELVRLIEKEREKGIFLSVLGFGTGNIKDNKMEALADHGNGNYAYIDTILEARKVLVEEMGGTLLTIAKDVKLQVEFNPAKVKGYRLIGYENRMLNNEDFDDDTKDAGEMGAGHRVTALYEIIPADSAAEAANTGLKYQQTQVVESDEWLNIKIRYKEPDQDKSNLLSLAVDDSHENAIPSESFTFASSVAEFGMLLRDSKYKGQASYENIYGRLAGLPSVKSDPYKAEFLQLVKICMDQELR